MAIKYLLIEFETNPRPSTCLKPYVYMENDYDTLDRAMENASRSSLAVLEIDTFTGETKQVMNADQISERLRAVEQQGPTENDEHRRHYHHSGVFG